ncbi:MAG: hypothetical protein ABR96_05540 [cyanobacterium BACL30 MAG-120619-bin27]|nr:MAG: hypothetical protein ABR96_05540 [cyanobacterium BACL30 MAG-120619-bin27]
MAAHTPSPATRLLLGLALAGVGLLGSLQGQALAQGLPKPSCPLVVPASQKLFQPRSIQPNQVQAKNAMGCLSPADAVYGADGCPLRICGAEAGVIELPDYNGTPR